MLPCVISIKKRKCFFMNKTPNSMVIRTIRSNLENLCQAKIQIYAEE